MIATLKDLGTPSVVAGDFNSTWDMAPFRRLLDLGYRDAAGPFAATYPPTPGFRRCWPSTTS